MSVLFWWNQLRAWKSNRDYRHEKQETDTKDVPQCFFHQELVWHRYQYHSESICIDAPLPVDTTENPNV